MSPRRFLLGRRQMGGLAAGALVAGTLPSARAADDKTRVASGKGSPAVAAEGSSAVG